MDLINDFVTLYDVNGKRKGRRQEEAREECPGGVRGSLKLSSGRVTDQRMLTSCFEGLSCVSTKVLKHTFLFVV